LAASIHSPTLVSSLASSRSCRQLAPITLLHVVSMVGPLHGSCCWACACRHAVRSTSA
jgi:hypothetical protein